MRLLTRAAQSEEQQVRKYFPALELSRALFTRSADEAGVVGGVRGKDGHAAAHGRRRGARRGPQLLRRRGTRGFLSQIVFFFMLLFRCDVIVWEWFP